MWTFIIGFSLGIWAAMFIVPISRKDMINIKEAGEKAKKDRDRFEIFKQDFEKYKIESIIRPKSKESKYIRLLNEASKRGYFNLKKFVPIGSQNEVIIYYASKCELDCSDGIDKLVVTNLIRHVGSFGESISSSCPEGSNYVIYINGEWAKIVN